VRPERGLILTPSVMRLGRLAIVSLKNPTEPLAAPPARNMRKRRLGFKALAWSLAIVVLFATVFHFSGDALLNRFVGPKIERAFSAHFPGFSLHLGALRYDFWSNRLRCDSVAMSRADGAPSTAGSISATGVHWERLLVGKPNPAQIFSSAQLEVTDLSAVLPGAEYRVQCGHLRISVPDSAIAAQTLTLQLVVSDETFFASALSTCTLSAGGPILLPAGRGFRRVAQRPGVSRPDGRVGWSGF